MQTRKKVMGFGTFDHLHPGHLFYLKHLKKWGDFLVIVIARDTSVKRIKKLNPTHNEKERLMAVRSAGIADEVVLGNEKDFYQVLRDHRPDVIGLGYDQKADEKAIERELPGVKVIRLSSFEPKKYKSSLFRK